MNEASSKNQNKESQKRSFKHLCLKCVHYIYNLCELSHIQKMSIILKKKIIL